MKQQAVFKNGELRPNPLGLSPDDLRVLGVWASKEVDCPYCLWRGPMDRFATYTKGTKSHPNKLSKGMMECPACHQRMRKNTLLKITDMSVEDFAWWFWENVFIFKMMKRVDADNFFARVKLWPYEERNKFWEVYWEFKAASKPEDVIRDREAWENYAKQYKTDEDEKKGLQPGDIVTVEYRCKNCGYEWSASDEYPPRTRGVQCPGCETFYTEIKEVR